MFKKNKFIVFILFLSVFFISGFFKNIFAEEPQVEFALNSDFIKETQDSLLYYELSGWWKPNTTGDFFLILEQKDSGIKDDLCSISIDKIPSDNIYFTYPNCNPDQPVVVVYPGITYSIYFSNSSKGEPISDCFRENSAYCLLSKVPENINEHDVFNNWNVDLKKDNNGYYYDISADIKEKEDSKVKVALFRSDGNGEIELLHPSFDLNSSSKLSVSTKDGGTYLKSGSYELRITYVADGLFNNPIQIYKIQKSVPGNSSPANTGSGSNSSSGSGSNSGIFTGSAGSGGAKTVSLVSNSCGYNGIMCDFTDLMSLINRVINYIFVLVLPISAIVFAYAGYLYIVSAGNAKKREAAKNAMTKLVIGIIIIMLAWIIVNTILKALGVQEGFSFLSMR